MGLLTRRCILAGSAVLPFVPALAQTAAVSYGSVRRHSAELDELIAANTPIEQIGWGYQWSEGPVWVKDGFLLFSDTRGNIVYRWAPGTAATPFLKPSGYDGKPDPNLAEPGSNGLAIDAQGALVMCDSGTRALAKVDLATKKKTILADRFEGKRFNSPNDLCITKSGAIYFTDPPYGLTNNAASPLREIPFCGVYRWAPDGSVTVIDKEMSRPNGIALSPDESTLFVTNSDPAKPILKSFALDQSGAATASDTVFDFTPMMMTDAQGLPDGLKIDADGNIFVTGPGGVLVLSKETSVLGLISVTGRPVSNVAFGGDGYLYMTANDIVARVQMKAK